MKKSIKIMAVMLSILAISGCSSEAMGEVVVETRVPVSVTSAELSMIKNDMVFAGQIKANEKISIVGKMSGRVDSVRAEVGDRVSAGQILFTLEEKDVRDTIRQLEASLNSASTSVNSAQTGLNQVTGAQFESSKAQLETVIETAKESVEVAKIGLEKADLALNDTLKSLENNKALFEVGAISQVVLDNSELSYNQAVTSHAQAQSQYNQAAITLTQAENNYSISTGSMISDSTVIATNSVNAAVASQNTVAVQLDIARSTLNDLSVKSPIDGVVTAKNIETGEMASAASAAYVIENLDKVTVNAKVSEIIINNIEVGQEVDVYVKAVGEEPTKGVVKTVSPSADATNVYPVQIEMDNSQGLLKPGMFAEVYFTKAMSNNTIVVKRNTVMKDENSNYVYVNNDGVAKRVAVETGIDNGEEIEITSGVSVGDKLITTGQSNVVEGDKLNVITSAAEGGAK